MLAFVYPFGRGRAGGGREGGGRLFCPECFIVCWIDGMPSVEHRACFIRFEGEGGVRGSGRACTRSLTVVNDEARDDRRNKGLIRVREDVLATDVLDIVGKEL